MSLTAKPLVSPPYVPADEPQPAEAPVLATRDTRDTGAAPESVRSGALAVTPLASANTGTAASNSNPFWDGLGRAASAGAPDALVYSNSALLAPPNAKSFVLLNPWTAATDPGKATVTQFISHPQNKVMVGGMPFNRVESVTYDLGGNGTRREDGFGTNTTLGQGQDKVTFFINGRGGDSNLANAKNGVSVNMGLFGSPAALRQVVDQMPAGGRTGAVKSALQRVLQASSAGGTQVGLAWRSTLLLNQKTGVLELDISGVKVPLADFTQGMQDAASVVALNHGNKPVAHTNNEEAYLNGANPYQRAADTRTPQGQYVNHGDPVAAIAGDILSLQQSLYPDDAPIRTNDQARQFLDTAIERSTWLSPADAKKWAGVDGVESAKVDPQPMSAADKTKLQGVLAQMGRYDLNFGSDRIQQASADALRERGAPSATSSATPSATPVSADQRRFVREVFQGTYRREAAQGYSSGDLVRDVLLGANRFAAPLADLFSPQPTARDEDYLARGANQAQGFSQRMALDGGTLKALGLTVPTGLSTAQAQTQATQLLRSAMATRLQQRNVANTSEAQYQAFRALTPNQREGLAMQIQAQLNTAARRQPAPGRGHPPQAPVRQGPVIDGIPMQGQAVRVQAVGAENSQRVPLQGDLMWGRTDSGSAVFWLAGRGTNYLLRDGQGALIGNQADALVRARQLIKNDGATDLRPLDSKVLASAPRTTAQTPNPAAAPRQAVAGIQVRSSSHLQWVGGIDPQGQAVQGELVFARDDTGQAVFLLKGTSTNYVLRDAQGQPVTNAVDAEQRAQELIKFGAARGLYPLQAEYLR
jgi:hypothetical protein